MKTKFSSLIFGVFSILCLAQQPLTWEDLSKIKYTEKYFPAYDTAFLHPEFSEDVKQLEGQNVAIKGYFLNIDPENKIYILSKGPMSSCFFCGVGGPETAIELQFDTKPQFKTDAIVEITGKLKLNAEDIEHFNYILTHCKGKLID